MVQGPKRLDCFLLISQSYQQGTGSELEQPVLKAAPELEQPVLKLALVLDAGTATGGLNHCATVWSQYSSYQAVFFFSRTNTTLRSQKDNEHK